MTLPTPSRQHRRPAGERQAIVITVRGEVNRPTARHLQALGCELIDTEVTALAIDCTQTPGPGGHLLGALRRVADAASRHHVDVGLAIGGAGGDVIRAHAPSVLTAPTLACLLDALGFDHDVAEIELITRPGPAQAGRT